MQEQKRADAVAAAGLAKRQAKAAERARMDKELRENVKRSSDERKRIQLALKKMSVLKGAANGVFDARTRIAIRLARAQFNLSPGDYVDLDLNDKLPEVIDLKALNLPWANRLMLITTKDIEAIKSKALRKKLRMFAGEYVKIGSFRDKIYLLVQVESRFFQLSERLKLRGMRIAEPRDSSTNQFLKRFAPRSVFTRTPKGNGQGPMIGLHKNKRGRFVWLSDGKSGTYRNWIYGRPNHPNDRGYRIINGQREDYDVVAYFYDRRRGLGWQAVIKFGSPAGYLVEFLR